MRQGLWYGSVSALQTVISSAESVSDLNAHTGIIKKAVYGRVWDASAAVEVYQAGQLWFRYTRIHYITKKLFSPCGIITDSQYRILACDFNNMNIHILEKLGSEGLEFKPRQGQRWNTNKVIIYSTKYDGPEGIILLTKSSCLLEFRKS